MANGQNDAEAKSKLDLNRFEHIQLGVWDLYIMRTRRMLWFPTLQKIEESTQIWKDIPYLRRTVRDMSTVAWPHMSAYLVITVARSLTPALSLWLVVRRFFSPHFPLLFPESESCLRASLSRFSGQVLGIVSIYSI